MLIVWWGLWKTFGRNVNWHGDRWPRNKPTVYVSVSLTAKNGLRFVSVW